MLSSAMNLSLILLHYSSDAISSGTSMTSDWSLPYASDIPSLAAPAVTPPSPHKGKSLQGEESLSPTDDLPKLTPTISATRARSSPRTATPGKKYHSASARRNTPVPPEDLKAALDAAMDGLDAPGPWKCGFCSYSQRRPRLPDRLRHLHTHGSENSIVCCGVPVEHAAKNGILGNRWNHWDGSVRIGGCGKTFSRVDAYKRHLRAQEGRCVSAP